MCSTQMQPCLNRYQIQSLEVSKVTSQVQDLESTDVFLRQVVFHTQYPTLSSSLFGMS